MDLGPLMGQGATDPSRLEPSQYAQVADFARQKHPEVMREVVREQPWLMKAMGNPVLMGVLGTVASRMIKRRMQSQPVSPQQRSVGSTARASKPFGCRLTRRGCRAFFCVGIADVAKSSYAGQRRGNVQRVVLKFLKKERAQHAAHGERENDGETEPDAEPVDVNSSGIMT